MNPRETVIVTCAFCRGLGIDPFGIMSSHATCQVCNGQKEHTILKPYVACAYCKGVGVEPGTRNSCLSCKGLGVISQNKGKLRACTTCKGSGMQEETHLTCLVCKGSGVLQHNTRTTRNKL